MAFSHASKPPLRACIARVLCCSHGRALLLAVLQQRVGAFLLPRALLLALYNQASLPLACPLHHSRPSPALPQPPPTHYVLAAVCVWVQAITLGVALASKSAQAGRFTNPHQTKSLSSLEPTANLSSPNLHCQSGHDQEARPTSPAAHETSPDCITSPPDLPNLIGSPHALRFFQSRILTVYLAEGGGAGGAEGICFGGGY